MLGARETPRFMGVDGDYCSHKEEKRDFSPREHDFKHMSVARKLEDVAYEKIANKG
jgi:hypothetical protein